MIDGHGDDIYGWDIAIKSNFSTNIFCKRVAELETHLQTKIGLIYNYPPPDAKPLRERIAFKENINEDSILVTSGAVDAIYLIAMAFHGHSAILSPTFSEYEDACKRHAHKISYFQELDDIESDATSVWICNPNNPDGRVFSTNDLEKLLSSNPNRLIIVDQAYEDYTPNTLFESNKVLEYPNLIILKSLTKKFSLPGLRVGYLIANPSVANIIKTKMMPWSVNALAIEAAIYCLDHENDFKINMPFLIKEKERLSHKLKELGIQSFPSDTNFLLCQLPRGTSNELKEYLLSQHGILIRDASNFNGLTPRHFRVAVQTRQENDNLISGIKSWLLQF